MEDEWIEEEQFVVAEVSGMIDSDVLSKRGGLCKVVGMNSEQPIVQVARYVFAGEYEDALGTCVIFEEQKQQQQQQQGRTGSNPEPALKYKCHTMKKLMLQRTFLSERKEGDVSPGGIEILALNDGEASGRTNSVCHYALDPKELQQHKAGQENSDESDNEAPEAGQSSVREDNETSLPKTADVSD